MDGFVYYWLILAVFLAIVEMLTPQFMALLFGFSALMLAVISWLFPELSIYWQILLFVILTLVDLYFWIKIIRHWRKKPSAEPYLNDRAKQYLGQKFILNYPIENHVGKLQIGDTLWKIRCEEAFLPIGTLVEINATTDNRLSVQRAN